MRARQPDRSGFVERDGVRVAWQEYGELARPQDPAVLLLPTWCIVPAEVWKLQVPYLARRTRVITFDPRGNGASDRPEHGSAYQRRADAGRARRAGRDRDRPSRGGRPVDGQPARPGSRVGPPGPRRRLGRDRTGHPGPGTVPPGAAGVVRPLGRGHRRRRGLGPLQPVLLAARLPGVPGLLLRPAGARGALDQADRGPRGMGAGTTGETLVRAEVGRVAGERRWRSSAPTCGARSSSCTGPTTGSSRTRPARGSPS